VRGGGPGSSSVRWGQRGLSRSGRLAAAEHLPSSSCPSPPFPCPPHPPTWPWMWRRRRRSSWASGPSGARGREGRRETSRCRVQVRGAQHAGALDAPGRAPTHSGAPHPRGPRGSSVNRTDGDQRARASPSASARAKHDEQRTQLNRLNIIHTHCALERPPPPWTAYATCARARVVRLPRSTTRIGGAPAAAPCSTALQSASARTGRVTSRRAGWRRRRGRRVRL